MNYTVNHAKYEEEEDVSARTCTYQSKKKVRKPALITRYMNVRLSLANTHLKLLFSK